MKKVLAFFIAFALIIGSVMPVYADNSADEKSVKISKDKAKEIMLKFFKDKLEFDIDLKKFNFNAELIDDYQDPSQKLWRFYWDNYDGNNSISLDASINANDGTVNEANKYEGSNRRTIVVANITKSKAKEIADSFIKRLHPEIEKELKYAEDESDSLEYTGGMGEASYYLRYIRIINGIKFENNYVNIGVDGQTGKITSYGYKWTKNDKLQFPSSDKVIENSKLKEILDNNAGLELIYKGFMVNGEGPGAPKHWKFVFNGDVNFVVDAKEGRILTLNGVAIDKNKKKDITKEQKEKIMIGAQNITVPKIEITEVRAREIAENNIKKYLGNDYKVNNIRYVGNEINGYTAEKKWDVNFNKNNDASGYMAGQGRISIDAETGKLMRFSLFGSDIDDKDFQPKVTIDQAYDRAIAVIAEQYPDYAGKIKTEQLLTEELYFANGKKIHQRNYRFRFPRVEDGVTIADNYINVTLDAKEGIVKNIDCRWSNDVKIPKLEGLIDKNKAKDILAAFYKPELQYMSFNRADDKSNIKPEAKLVYKLKSNDFFVGIDAKSGKPLDYEGNEIVDGKDDFSKIIKGHKLEKELSILASQGIIDKKSFMPDKQLSRIDAVKMLVNVKSNVYGRSPSNELLFTDIKNTNANYSIIKLAVYYGIVDNKKVEFKADQKITREEFAELIVKGMGYDKAAKVKGIYTIDSKDAKEVDGSRIGYVAICRGMHIMSDIKGNFEPKAGINMVDASTAIFKALSGLSEVK